jgi:kanamycin kinase/streptomycin 3"-kinase/aminoglycoside 3'-phosphotransferase-2
VQGWEDVSTGHTDAVVRRSPAGDAYAKTASGAARDELEDERDRLLWLETTDLPAPQVLDWDDHDGVATLTTSGLRGVPLSALPASATQGAVKALGGFLRRLHAVDLDGCPFERWLAVTVPQARLRVDQGLMEASGLDEERRGRSPEDLLEQLIADRPEAERREQGDLVLCHGDACLPNFLLDPATLEITGMVDVGRLGVADRHLDLALASRSMGATELNPAFGPAEAEAMLASYGLPADPWRLDFYRLLDEFF